MIGNKDKMIKGLGAYVETCTGEVQNLPFGFGTFNGVSREEVYGENQHEGVTWKNYELKDETPAP